MLNILRSDIYKLFRTKSFLVIILISVLMSAGSLLLLIQASKIILPASTQSTGLTVKSSETISINSNISPTDISKIVDNMTVVEASTQVFNDEGLLTLVAIFASLLVGLDFSSGAMKNIASKGISRNKIYLSKLLTTFLGTFIIMTFTLISVILCSLIVFEVGDFNTQILLDSIVNISKQTLLYFGITSVFIAIAYIFKNNVLSIICSVCVILVLPSIVAMLDSNFFILPYCIPTILKYSINPVVNPFLLSIIYIVISTIIGCTLFKKQDIK